MNHRIVKVYAHAHYPEPKLETYKLLQEPEFITGYTY